MGGLVNLNNGRIVGVKKGTREYYHEVGHLEFADSEKGIIHHAKQDLLLKIFYVSLLVSIIQPIPFIVFSCFVLMMYFVLEIAEEQWCWRYADEVLGKKRV